MKQEVVPAQDSIRGPTIGSNLNKTKAKKRASRALMLQDIRGVVDVLDPMHYRIVNGLPVHVLHVGRLDIEFTNAETPC